MPTIEKRFIDIARRAGAPLLPGTFTTMCNFAKVTRRFRRKN